MKKIILAALLILILAGAGVPFVSGIMMERTLKQTFSDINQIYQDKGLDLSYEISEYDRNFLSSMIVWKIKFGALKTFYGVDEIVFVDRAKHGFSRVVSHTSLEKNKWFTDLLDQQLNGENPLGISTVYNYSGNFLTTVTLDGFSLEKDHNVFAFMPGSIVMRIDKDLKDSSMQGALEGFSVSDKFTVNQVSVNSKMEKLSNYIWGGNVALSVQKIEAGEGSDRVTLSNVTCDYAMDLDKVENALSLKLRYGTDGIIAGRNQIEDAVIQIGINHLDVDGVEAFMKLYTELTSKAIGDFSAAPQQHSEKTKKDLEKQFASLGLQMAGACEKLMKQGLEFQISALEAKLPQGQIKGDFSLGLKKDMTMVQFAPLMMQPALALDVFSLKSNLSLPYKLVGANPKLLNPMYPGMRTGLFVKKGDDMVHNAETRNGKLFLNGEELVLTGM